MGYNAGYNRKIDEESIGSRCWTKSLRKYEVVFAFKFPQMDSMELAAKKIKFWQNILKLFSGSGVL
jgi:hypothetical protein